MRSQAANQPDQVYDELVRLIYSAAVDPAQWQVFLDHISAQCGHIPVHLFGHDNQNSHCFDLLYAGYDDAFMDAFRDYYSGINTWAPGFFELPIGQTHDIQRMYPERELLKTEFYADWVQPQGDIRKGGGVMLFKDDTRMFALGANIRQNDGQTLVQPWLQLLDRLTPHLQQSLEISRKLAGLTIEKSAMAEHGATPDSALLVIDRHARLLYANTEAQRHLTHGGVVQIGIGSTVTLTDSDAESQIANLRRRLDQPASRTPARFRITAPDGTALICHCANLQIAALSPALTGLLTTSDNNVLLLVLSQDPDILLADSLRNEHGLTRREAAVAIDIGSGKTTARIAAEQARSVHTIRDQRKAAMAKLGVSHQAALILMLNRLRERKREFTSFD